MRSLSRSWWLALAPAALLGAVVLGVHLKHGRDEAAVVRSDPEEIMSEPALRQVALGLGRPVYQDNCASCHGADGRGDTSLGVPDLTSGEHLYGQGRVSEIEFIAAQRLGRLATSTRNPLR